MKIIALIFVAYLSVLTVEPVAYEIYAMSKHHSCCGMKCCSKNKQCSDGLPASCNNCATCSICLGSYVHEDTYTIQPEITKHVFASTASAKLISNYCANCFRPPEVV